MIEPWFDPVRYAWVAGTLLGVLCGLEGTLAGLCAPRGKCKGLVLGVHFGMLAFAVVLLAAGIAAYFARQPYGVWYGLGFPGLLGLVIVGSLTPVVLKAYRMADLRKSLAKDL
jgi:hypothetical protein